MLNKQVIYNVGVYLRLSKEDGDDTESESITNQRKIINDYIKKNENFIFYDEYVDDGYSGTNFNRPSFKRMIKDIENKKINMVITKSLSRLGRNYIETGYYIEKYFPDYNVRYIALLDNIDNFEESINNDFMPIKSVFNEKYALDTSIAVKKTKRKRMQEGFYACNTTPFGYKKDINNKGKLIIDEESSKTVKKIFELKVNGYTIPQIVKYLDRNHYKTPAEYLNIRGLESVKNKNIWRKSSVIRILSNQVYLGHCVRGKTQNISYKSKDRIYVNRNDFIITKNTHEPIISEEEFQKVHNINNYGITRKRSRLNYLLKDLIYCKNCGKKLIFKKERSKVYVYCRNNAENSKLCSNNCKINYDLLEKKILEYISNLYSQYIKEEKTQDNLYKKYMKNTIIKSETELKEYNTSLKHLNFKISSLYNQRLLDKINEDEYKKIYKNFLDQRKNLNEKITEVENEIECEKDKLNNLYFKKEVLQNLKQIKVTDFQNIEIKDIIEKIEIFENEIIVNFMFKKFGKISML